MQQGTKETKKKAVFGQRVRVGGFKAVGQKNEKGSSK